MTSASIRGGLGRSGGTMSPFVVECGRKSLAENFRFQRCCLLRVRLVRPRVGSGGSDPGCLAEKLLTNEQDCRARGEEQWRYQLVAGAKPPSKDGAYITPAPASRVQAFAIGRATPTEDQ